MKLINTRDWTALFSSVLVAVRFSFLHRAHFVESEAFQPVAENCVLWLGVVINKKDVKVILQN